MSQEKNPTSKTHPVRSTDEGRICPVTGKEFRFAYSELELLDSCEACRPAFAIVGIQTALRASDSDYHKNL
jgi:hypothetical protein